MKKSKNSLMEKAKNLPWKTIIIVFAIVTSMVVGFYIWQTYLAPTAEEAEGEGALSATTISFDNYNYNDAEDLSFVNATMWTTTSSFDASDDADMYPSDLSASSVWVKNVSNNAEDISVDLSDYNSYVYIQIDSGDYSMFESDEKLVDFSLISGNAELIFNIYQKPNNVAVTNVEKDTSKGLPTADGNYTVTTDSFQKYDTLSAFTNDHIGGNFDTTTKEYNALTSTEQAFWLDEDNFCSIPTLYNRSDDTANLKAETSAKELALFTEAPAYKITFNDTIGSDNTVTDVNLTTSDTSYKIFDNTGNNYAFAVSKNPLMPGDSFKYELATGANITINAMQVGSLSIPSYTQPSSITFTSHGSV